MTRGIAALLLLAACSQPAPDRGAPAASAGSDQTATAEAAVASLGPPVEVARGLTVPWSIAFAPDGRMLVTERPGRVVVIEKGAVRKLFDVPNVESRSEIGLMGLALHPQFATNRLLYLAYGTSRGGDLAVDVVRYRETGTTLTDATPIIQNLPAASNHAGCRIKFGPDGKLYITTGDATDGDIAQDMQSLGGKLLRVNDDGSIPADNPFPGSPIWTLGHRNAQGIDWDPKSGVLWSSEHGPSGFDGGFGADEVNLVERGKNYGWPRIHHRETAPGLVSPFLEYSPAHAPASGAFWRGDFWFGCLRGSHLHHVVIDPNDRRKVLREEELFDGDYGRIREVAAGPDGALYFTTSNRDGRGNVREGDDRVFKIE